MTASAEKLLTMYETMETIREFETRAAVLFAAGEFPGFVHLYIGEEAVATGTMAAIETADYMTSTHRGHGHCLAKGGEPRLMMAELFGKKAGYCGGKGGSMHIADPDLGILGANGVVGAGMALACGAAFASKYENRGSVAVCMFGDGASNRGTFHETLNMAAIWNLPVVFVCENNGYQISMCLSDHCSVTDVADRAVSYGIPGIVVDGNDVVAVYEAVSEAVKRARAGEGPTLVECKTWRHRGHFEGDPTVYRNAQEHESWLAKDPIVRCRAMMIERGFATAEQLDAIDAAVGEKIEEAVEFARSSPFPPVEDLLTGVYAG
jgi:pyruvate dehydrogenase E1 component alpha subunit